MFCCPAATSLTGVHHKTLTARRAASHNSLGGNVAESRLPFRIASYFRLREELMQQAYRVRGRLAADGTLTLEGLHFRAGEEVEVIVLAESKAREERRYPLRGKPLDYEDPFAPVAEADWQALR
jgi:hypothetical protein